MADSLAQIEAEALQLPKPRMRLLLLAFGTLTIAACANSVPTDTCQLEHPPGSARILVTHGVSLATFPARIPAAYTGCQRTWFGDERDPGGMRILATSHFASGSVIRFEGTAPDGPAYDCRYVQGTLDAAASVNAQSCPLLGKQVEEAGK